MSSRDQVRETFLAAIERPKEERTAFLDAASLDPNERAEIESLLEHHDQADGFLSVAASESPLLQTGALPFDRIADFELEREIGRGGMGAVYLATEQPIGRQVALKILLVGLSLSETGLARFHTEARTAARLSHDAIVPVYRFGSEKGTYFIASKYISGATLTRELDPQTRLGLAPAPKDYVAIARFIAVMARALEHAHQHEVIHRDVKTSNILIDEQGRPYLADFGLARDLNEDGHTRSGDIAGTFAYMSPEQALGKTKEIDHRTDIYSLGVVLYEMLSGQRPFEGKSSIEVVEAITRREPAAPRHYDSNIPVDLQVICLKALEKQPSARFEYAELMARDLEDFAAGRAIQARAPSLAARTRRKAKRYQRALITSAAITVVGALGIGGGLLVRPAEGTPVKLGSTPPGAEVYVRPLVPDTSEYGPPQRLGTTPLETRVEAGMVRFVFLGADGLQAELSRKVPTVEALESVEGRDHLDVSAVLGDTTTVFAEMIRIPEGRFIRGAGEDPRDFGTDERSMASFLIDRLEVSIADYRRFLEATGRSAPISSESLIEGGDDSWNDFPITGVSFHDARAYAEWLGKRLPTFDEWQRAARGVDGREVPWDQEDAPADSVRQWACVDRGGGVSFTEAISSQEIFLALASPIGTHPKDRSPDGVMDMLGSVAEWVDSPWASVEEGVLNINDGMRCVVGAAWIYPMIVCKLYSLTPVGANSETNFASGFRCAISVDPLATPQEVSDEQFSSR